MLDIIISNIKNLEEEAATLVQHRDAVTAQLKQIDIRLHQITGAITELKKIVEEQNEHRTTSKSTIREDISETNGSTATRENSVQTQEAYKKSDR